MLLAEERANRAGSSRQSFSSAFHTRSFAPALAKWSPPLWPWRSDSMMAWKRCVTASTSAWSGRAPLSTRMPGPCSHTLAHSAISAVQLCAQGRAVVDRHVVGGVRGVRAVPRVGLLGENGLQIVEARLVGAQAGPGKGLGHVVSWCLWGQSLQPNPFPPPTNTPKNTSKTPQNSPPNHHQIHLHFHAHLRTHRRTHLGP